MKIFANNFALILTRVPEHRHFQFETHSIDTVSAQIRADEALFPSQVWYIRAEKEKKLAEKLFQLQSDFDIRQRYIQVEVLFEDDEKKAAFIQKYRKRFQSIVAAGGLVLNEKDELLMIFREGLWDLPKGKLEKGEELKVAAWREVAEETGLEHHITGEKAAETYHIFFARNGKWRFKTTHWYFMRTYQPESFAPQVKEGITKVAWRSLSELRAEMPATYPQIKGLIRTAMTHVESR